MSNPFQQIGQAIRQALQAARQQFGRSPGRVHTEHIRVNPKSTETKPVYRVGVDYKQKGTVDPTTGERFVTGNLPTKAGVAEALARVPSGRVEVLIYGEPAWDTRKRTSPPPDNKGNVHIAFFADKSELQAALAGPVSIEDWVANSGEWNFKQVLAVSVAEG